MTSRNVYLDKARTLWERRGDALPLAEAAVRAAPNDSTAWLLLGEIQLSNKKYADALASAQRVIAMTQGEAGAYLLAGKALRLLGQNSEALQHLDRATALDARLFEAALLAGHAARELSIYDPALAYYERALSANPKSAEVHFNLGDMYRMQSRAADAVRHYTAALDLDPGFAGAFANRARLLPIVYRDMAEIESCRCRYENGLAALENTLDLSTARGREFALKGILASTNFFLQYQGKDDRALQARYGDYVCRVVAACYPQWSTPVSNTPLAEGERIRIGYCSAYLRNHNGAVWLLGWLRHRNRDRFEVFCYHTSVRTDAKTEAFRQLADHFVHITRDFERVCARIRADRLHILVYPELGMDPATLAIAGLRLAPRQCVGWGHPITSGMETMDYWLSSNLMEPENGQDHYTEKLVRLPNMAHVYSRTQREQILATPPPKSRRNFGLPDDAVIYLATQSLFKYLPEHDWLFPAIARQVPGARIVFIQISGAGAVRQFMARIDAAFRAQGMWATDHCIMLPRQSPADYVTLNRVADVFLDNPAWSGNNTTLTALDCELPVVTCPTTFMRGRHACGILGMLGITETVAHGLDEYVDIAARLGSDAPFRASVRARIREQLDHLYDDTSCVASLEAFYESIVQRAP